MNLLSHPSPVCGGGEDVYSQGGGGAYGERMEDRAHMDRQSSLSVTASGGSATHKDHQSLIRAQFPLIHGSSEPDRHPLAFLDSAASSQKPQRVIDRISQYYTHEHANIHRGLYTLSEQATAAFEQARHVVAEFIGAAHSSEVIFTRGCTEAINLVASSWGGSALLGEDDELILSVAEHHANIVPWHILQQRQPFTIRYVPLTSTGQLDMPAFRRMLSPQVKLVSLAHVSNVLGWVNPVAEIVQAAHAVGAKVLIDGAQAVPHQRVNVRELGADFYTFSAHKMCGPTGTGVLWGSRPILEAMPPYQGGGDMILTVGEAGFEPADLPHKFEAGTPHIAGVLGLAAAVDFLNEAHAVLDVAAHSRGLALECLAGLAAHPHISLCHGDIASAGQLPGEDWQGIISLYHRHIHAHDLACFLDSRGVCVRAGHHCAMPLHHSLGVPATLRISPYLYNTSTDIQQLLKALREAEEFFGTH